MSKPYKTIVLTQRAEPWIHVFEISEQYSIRMCTGCNLRCLDWRSAAKDRPDIFLVVERPSVLTLGKRGICDSLLMDEAFLQERGIPISERMNGKPGDCAYGPTAPRAGQRYRVAAELMSMSQHTEPVANITDTGDQA